MRQRGNVPYHQAYHHENRHRSGGALNLNNAEFSVCLFSGMVLRAVTLSQKKGSFSCIRSVDEG